MRTTIFRNKRGLLAGLAFGALSLAGIASAQQISTRVDNILVNFPDVQPQMIHGRVMVPVRGVFEHMNANVDWDNQTQVVTAQRGNDNIRLPINSLYATVNGRQVRLDSPATVSTGRTMVPLRFLSEALGSSVDWVASTRTVEISTAAAYLHDSNPNSAGVNTMRMDTGTVIPFTMNQKLSSNGSDVGDKFTASLDTNGSSNYQGMASGAILEGHVDTARAKSGDTPGVLGLAFDRVRMPNGQTYKVHGSLIGLDANSVESDNGRLTAKPGAKKDNLKYVGYGAGAGALISVLTKGNLVSNTLIGAALGFLYGEIKKDPSKSRDVTSETGSKFGVRLTRDLTFTTMVDTNKIRLTPLPATR